MDIIDSGEAMYLIGGTLLFLASFFKILYLDSSHPKILIYLIIMRAAILFLIGASYVLTGFDLIHMPISGYAMTVLVSILAANFVIYDSFARVKAVK